jgi:Putative zinc-finger
VTCPYARNDGVYVLGALPPEERHQYEEHVRDCATCAAAVRELAGLPGLLARLPAEQVIGRDGDRLDPPLPATVLPRLLRRIGKERRVGRLRVALAAAAAAAVVGVGGTMVVQHATAPQQPRPARTFELAAVGPHKMSGEVQLIGWGWGTTVRMVCHDVPKPDSSVYTLYVTDRSGTQYLVSSWHSLPNQEATIPGAVALSPEDVASVQVKDDQQVVVLEGH